MVAYDIDLRRDQVCCEGFHMALQGGTDNEGYGPLLSHWHGEWRVGLDLPEIQYCPWCGRSLEEIPIGGE